MKNDKRHEIEPRSSRQVVWGRIPELPKDLYEISDDGHAFVAEFAREDDAILAELRYNAYPRLVEALHGILLGSTHDWEVRSAEAQALLKELGE